MRLVIFFSLVILYIKEGILVIFKAVCCFSFHRFQGHFWTFETFIVFLIILRFVPILRHFIVKILIMSNTNGYP